MLKFLSFFLVIVACHSQTQSKNTEEPTTQTPEKPPVRKTPEDNPPR